jgi:peroxiredoxin
MTTNSAIGSHARKRSRSTGRTSGWSWSTKAVIIGVVLLIVLGFSWVAWTNNGAPGKFAFQVGTPHPGAMAPPIRLGGFDLASLRGKTVLLYFQEGVMCQPCWDQLRDIEANSDKFRALGIDTIVSVTTDPADLVNEKVHQEHLTTPVLSDPTLAVSKAYNANLYGMMGQSRDGHTFIVVGPDGRIRWRADYGGAPQYTMYVPVSNLLADIGQGLTQTAK